VCLQLNTEKLEYNWRVLLERDVENGSTVAAQKRKLARQRDVLSGLKAAAAGVERRQREADLRVTEEYRRCTEQVQDLQAKVALFHRADAAQHVQLAAMQHATAAAAVTRLLHADKLLHEQQLGWAWHPPATPLLHHPDPGPAAAGPAESPDSPGEGQPEGAGAGPGSWLDACAEEWRPMLSMLCDEAGFLVTARIDTAVRGEHGPGRIAKAGPRPQDTQTGATAKEAQPSPWRGRHVVETCIHPMMGHAHSRGFHTVYHLRQVVCFEVQRSDLSLPIR
jgi:dynein regulatory complex protein 1